MASTNWKALSATALLIAIGIGFAVAPRNAHADRRASNTPPPYGQLQDTGEDNSFWWIEGGDQSAATLWIGPSMMDEHGLGTRHWTLVTFLLGSEEPLSCLQGTAHLDDAARIYLSGGAFRVEARPRDGLTWASVASVDDLSVEADGFY